MIEVRRYAPPERDAWNAFVATAKNGLFLFDRGYMDDQADRFDDHSLLFWEGARLVGLLPASQHAGRLVSHGGLTFGGILTDQRMRVSIMLEIFAALRLHLRDQGFASLTYKAIPHIYHQAPAEEDLYALTVNGARLVGRDVSFTLDLRETPALAKGWKWSPSRAPGPELQVAEERCFSDVMALEQAHLAEKSGARPTQTGAKMELLAGRFPEGIRLFTARHGGALLGGVIIYQTRMVAHAQYIATNDAGRELGARDAIMHHLLNSVYSSGPACFDFGVSTGTGETYLNAGLVANKETYGARATVHDFYELDAS